MFSTLKVNTPPVLAYNTQKRSTSDFVSFKARITECSKNSNRPERKVGWVLDVGGAKGVFQAGAMEALLDAGYKPDLIKGTSAGAINTSFMLGNGDHIKGLKAIWKKMSVSKIMGISLKKFKSLMDNTPLREGIHTQIDTDLVFDTLKRNGTEMIIHSTQLGQYGIPAKKAFFATKKSYHRLKDVYKDDETVSVKKLTKDNLKQAILSSSSLPLIFPVESIGDKKYSDGGIFNNRPSEDGNIALGSLLDKDQKGLSFVVLCHPTLEKDIAIDEQKLEKLGLDQEDVKTVVIAPSERLGVKFLSFNKAGNESGYYLDYGYATALSKLKGEGLISNDKYDTLLEIRKNERYDRMKLDLAA